MVVDATGNCVVLCLAIRLAGRLLDRFSVVRGNDGMALGASAMVAKYFTNI